MNLIRRTVLLAGIALVAAVSAAAAQTYRTVTATRDRMHESHLNINVEFAVGHFTLKPQAGRALFSETLTYDEDHFTPLTAYDPAGESLRAGVKSLRHSSNVNYRDNSPQALDLTVTPFVPASLALKFGAVEADVNLGGMSLANATIETGASQSTVRFDSPNRQRCDNLTMSVGAAQFEATNLGNARCDHLEINGGVGELTLDFGGAWDASSVTNGKISVGLGSVTLRLPRDLGVAVTLDRFLASFDDAGFTKRGSTYYSRNYDSASAKLRLDVSAALGEVRVEWTGR